MAHAKCTDHVSCYFLVPSKAKEPCYQDGGQLAASLVDHQKKESIAPEKMNSLFPLLTGFWSMLLLPVRYTFTVNLRSHRLPQPLIQNFSLLFCSYNHVQ